MSQPVVRVRFSRSAAVVTVSGELDIRTVPTLRRVMREVLDRRPEGLIFDLADVTFIDCGSARALAAASRALPGTGKAVIWRMSWRVGRLLRLTGMSRHFLIGGPSPPGSRPGAGGPPPSAPAPLNFYN